MPGSFTASSHRAKGSWTPRLAGVAVVVVLVGGGLAVYLGSVHGKPPAVVKPHHHAALPARVASTQTVGIIGFGVYDDGDAWHKDFDDHPMTLIAEHGALDFVRVPGSEINSGTPEWTADKLTDGGEIFIYVPTGQCLTSAHGGLLRLIHCDLGADQRWRTPHSEVVLGEPIAQYANAQAGGCLTAGRKPGAARLAGCAQPGTKAFKTQEIAFWWSA